MNFRSGTVLGTAVILTAGGLALWMAAGGSPRTPSIVIVTLDTTRADMLSPYGLMDAPMAHLERLAREGVVFDQATTVAPLTLPAHASLFTGLFPPSHGVRDNADPALSPTHTTLAEALRAQGFRTAAFVGSVVLAADRGLAQGFEHYGEVGPGDGGGRLQRRGDEVAAEAIDWIANAEDGPFFVWVHLYDPHRPYDAPDPYRSLHGNPYVAEIAFADAQIGRLLDALDRRALLDRTVVIVAGDHGESLGEHGERDHGIFVYESVLRVPLIVRAPGVTPGRVGEVVRLVDVMPTVLDLSGLPGPDSDGVSLVDLLRGTRWDLDLEAYAESLYPQRFGWSPLRSLRSGRYKVIEAPRPELYDLARDPFEQRNVHGERRAVAAAMTARLAELGSARSDAVLPDSESRVSPEVEERLAALGYVGSPRREAPASGEALPDPKDCIQFHRPAGEWPDVPPDSRSSRCAGAKGGVAVR